MLEPGGQRRAFKRHLSQTARRDTEERREAAYECSQATIANIEANVRHAALCCEQQPYRSFSAYSGKKLARWKPCDLSKYPVEMIGTHKGEGRHLAQGETLVKLSSNYTYNPKHRTSVALSSIGPFGRT